MKFNYKYLLAIFTIIITGAVIYYLSDIVTYILMAWVISMIGAPVVVFLRRFVGKNIAALFTLSLFVLGFMLLVWIFIPPLVNQIENLSKVDYNKVVTALEEPIKDWEKWLINKKLMIASDTLTQRTPTLYPDTARSFSHVVTLDSTLADWDSLSGQPIKIIINLDNNITKSSSELSENTAEKAGFFEILKENMSTYLNPQKIQQMFGESLSAFGNVMVGVFSIFFMVLPW